MADNRTYSAHSNSASQLSYRRRRYPLSSEFRAQVQAMLRGEVCDTTIIDNSETAFLAEYAFSSELIGPELALAASNGEPYVGSVVKMLQQFSAEKLKCYEKKSQLKQLVEALSAKIKALPVEPFIYAYRISNQMATVNLSFEREADTSVSQFFHVITRSDRDAVSDDLDWATCFARWLNCDFDEILSVFRNCYKEQGEKNSMF